MHVTTNTFLWVKKLFCCIFISFLFIYQKLRKLIQQEGFPDLWRTSDTLTSCVQVEVKFIQAFFFFLPPCHRLTWEVWSDQPDSANSKGLDSALYSRAGISRGDGQSPSPGCVNHPHLSLSLCLYLFFIQPNRDMMRLQKAVTAIHRAIRSFQQSGTVLAQSVRWIKTSQ